jgi:hypothetical protein
MDQIPNSNSFVADQTTMLCRGSHSAIHIIYAKPKEAGGNKYNDASQSGVFNRAQKPHLLRLYSFLVIAVKNKSFLLVSSRVAPWPDKTTIRISLRV